MVQVPEKARQYHLPKREGIDSLTIRTVDVPKPAAREVLVKIHAVGLNFRDIMIAKDEYAGFGAVPDDLIPCSDGAGEVVAVGPGVTKWAVGDRVVANFCQDYVGAGPRVELLESALGGAIHGVLTEYKIFPEHGLVRIPAHLSYEEASTLPCAAITAWHALHGPISVKAGDYVLVQGTGGVSIFALQFAVASGAVVIATSSSNAKLAKARELGAEHTINYKETPDWDREVLRLTHGEGVEHVVDVGGADTISKSLGSLCKLGGCVHIVGALCGLQPQAQGEVSLVAQILTRHATVRNVMLGPRIMFEQLNRALAARKIRPVVDRVFAFEDAPAAFRHLESQTHVGKVVVRVAH